jgi:pilus assembly protein CpaE
MMPKLNGYEFCRQARSKPILKKTPIIVFSARFQPVDKQTALDAGATDYISKSTAPDLLINRIEELLPQREQEKEAISTHTMMALFSLRGGAGVTSLSVNLAIILTQMLNKTTTVIDLAPMGGHTAIMLGLRPTNRLNQLVGGDLNRVPFEAIQSNLLKHQSGVQVLASAPGFEPGVNINHNLMRGMESLKTSLPVTVLDAPQLLETHTSRLAHLLDHVLLVSTADMPAIQSALTALNGLAKLEIAADKIKLIINQTTPYNNLPLAMIERTVRRPIVATIPFDPNMMKAVNSGNPLVLAQPESPAAAAIIELAKKLAE